MILAQPLKLALAAALAAGAIALPAAAQPQSVTPLSVTGDAPISVRVNIHAKDRHAVVNEVFKAAHFVCRNAVGSIGLDLGDVDWCADRAQAKAMKQYAVIVKERGFAASDAIVLSAR